MVEMSKRAVITAPCIIAFFHKTYDIQISPGTVYPILYAMERNERIRRLPNRPKKSYVLTESGRNEIVTFQNDRKEILYFIVDLIHR